MISLSRKKTVEIPFLGVTVTVDFVVPTALEVEENLKGGTKDSAIFEAFVTKVTSPDIEGWQEGVGAKTVLESPGTYPLVNKAALEVVQTAFISEAEKNG